MNKLDESRDERCMLWWTYSTTSHIFRRKCNPVEEVKWSRRFTFLRDPGMEAREETSFKEVCPGEANRDIMNAWRNMKISHPIVFSFRELPHKSGQGRCRNNSFYQSLHHDPGILHRRISVLNKRFYVQSSLVDRLSGNFVATREQLGWEVLRKATHIDWKSTRTDARKRISFSFIGATTDWSSF